MLTANWSATLILDFGAGSSVMLALSAYNLGPSRVKTAVRKVQDPIKQRSFWYLYRLRAVPPETREYVPKVRSDDYRAASGAVWVSEGE